MDMDMIKYFASLSVGGVLAWGMFMVYRKDIKGTADAMTLIVKENTAAITELTSYLREEHGGGRRWFGHKTASAHPPS